MNIILLRNAKRGMGVSSLHFSRILEALTLPDTVTLPVTCHNYSVQSHCFQVAMLWEDEPQ